jgi:predicted nucleotidyltransferase
MKLSAPIESLVPGLRGRVLTAMVRAATPLSLRELARRAGSADSPSSVKRVVLELLEEGMAFLALSSKANHFYDLNREHLVVRHLIELDRAKENTLVLIETQVAQWPHLPRSVVLFGSVARGEDTSRSDVDLLVVWEGENPTSDQWTQAKHLLSNSVRDLTGNSVSLMEFSHKEWDTAVEQREPLLDAIAREGVRVAGESVRSLMRPRGGK